MARFGHFVTNKLSETGYQMGRVRTNEITPETYFEWKGKIIGVTHQTESCQGACHSRLADSDLLIKSCKDCAGTELIGYSYFVTKSSLIKGHTRYLVNIVRVISVEKKTNDKKHTNRQTNFRLPHVTKYQLALKSVYINELRFV